MREVLLFLFLASQLLITAQRKPEKIVTGKLPIETFVEDVELRDWFVKEYESYRPDETVIENLKALLADKKITVVLGTWCSDSQREFPRLIKVLDAIHFPNERLLIYGTNKKKSKPIRVVGKYKITHVPTIILFNKERTERGRITENVKISVEADLQSMF